MRWTVVVLVVVGGCGRVGFAPVTADGSGGDGGNSGAPVNLVAAHILTSCAIVEGALWCWGQNGAGQLLTGTTAVQGVPVRIGSDTDWTDVMPGQDHICGIRASGDLYCWGGNDSGQLGVGDFLPRMTPTKVMLPAPVGAVDAWFHTCVVLGTGELWCWGKNNEGQLGQNDLPGAADIPSPVRVTTTAQWIGVAVGQGHTFGIDGDTLYGAGRNSMSELGLGMGAESQYHTMTSVGTGFGSAVAGQQQSCAVRSDGRLQCWGENTSGQLGTGDLALRDVPTTIGSGYSAVDLDTFHGCGWSNGTAACWGRNVEGQLGVGDQADRTTPTMSGFTDWIQISVGRFHTCGMRGDLSVWCVGQNTLGQVGVPGQSEYDTWQRVL